MNRPVKADDPTEPPDMRERRELCDLFDRIGPFAPTLLDGWIAHDLAAHLVLREHDPLAGPCLVLPGPFQRFGQRRQAKLARSKDFDRLVARLRSGPPFGFFRLSWVRSFPTLNEFFVHHEDLRRPNSGAVRIQPGNASCIVEERSARWPLPESATSHLRARRRLGGYRAAGDCPTGRAEGPAQRLTR